MASPAYSPWSPAISLLAISVLLHSATAPPPELVPPSTPPASDCVNELVMFSPCLSFVSSPPNNLSGDVPSKCCDAFSTALNSASGFCLCFLLRQPRMLGFPLDESKVLSLPSLCPQRNPSLRALCSGNDSEAISPDSDISNPPDSAPSGQPSPLMGLPLESNNSIPPPSSPPDSKNSSTKSSPPRQLAKRPPTQPRSLAVDPISAFPSAANQLKSSRFWFQTSILVSPFLIFTCLA